VSYYTAPQIAWCRHNRGAEVNGESMRGTRDKRTTGFKLLEGGRVVAARPGAERRLREGLAPRGAMKMRFMA